jgi:hypothetical protein
MQAARATPSAELSDCRMVLEKKDIIAKRSRSRLSWTASDQSVWVWENYCFFKGHMSDATRLSAKAFSALATTSG